MISGFFNHWGRVTHIYANKLAIIDSDKSHYLNQCWNIVNWTLRSKLQWNLYRNLCIFIQENAFENVVWKMSPILSRPQCVNISGIIAGRPLAMGDHGRFIVIPQWCHKRHEAHWYVCTVICGIVWWINDPGKETLMHPLRFSEKLLIVRMMQ